MKKAFRFLWMQYISTILGVNLVLGALVVGLNCVFSGTTFFGTYLLMYPMFPIMFLVIYGYTLTTLYQGLALSFHCRRTDLFWASQISFLVCAAGCTAILILTGAVGGRLIDLPALAEEFPPLAAGLAWADVKVWPFLLVMGLCLQPVGAALGCLYRNHRVISTVILVVMLLLAIAATSLSFFLADGSLTLPGWLIPGVVAVLGAAAAVSEVYYYRSNTTAVVR